MRPVVGAAAVLLVALASLVAQVQGAPDDGSRVVDHKFPGHFKCGLSDPKSNKESCLSTETRKNQSVLWLNETWTHIEISLDWSYQSETGIQRLGLVLVLAADAQPIFKSVAQALADGYRIQYNLTRAENSTNQVRMEVLKESPPRPAPRAYDQQFNITVREVRPPPAGAPSASQTDPSTGGPGRAVSNPPPMADDAAAPSAFGDAPVFQFAILSPFALLAAWWSPLRTKMLVWGAVGLRFFARQPPKRLLEHPRRRLLVDLVMRHPGIRAHQLQQVAELANGPFRFHLQLLLRHGFLRRERLGGHFRLFTPEANGIVMDADDVATRLERLVRTNPGLAQVELAHQLGVPVKTVHYHVTLARRRGRLRLVPDGRASRVFWNA